MTRQNNIWLFELCVDFGIFCYIQPLKGPKKLLSDFVFLEFAEASPILTPFLFRILNERENVSRSAGKDFSVRHPFS